jgi:uncharacterized protein involved in exopolysaccharide biosynthesis
MNSALNALVRFWWLPLVGVAAGVLAAAVLISRQPPTIYTATDTVLVNSPSAPYLRTAQTQSTALPAPRHSNAAGKGAKKKRQPAQPTVRATTSAPDTQVLVNAANLYPLLIQSDEIRKLRESLYGKTPGRVTATALASSTNTYGVYHPSPLPVITVKTTSRRSRSAQKLAADTVSAFGVWIAQRQKDAGIPKSERITIEQLRVRVQSSSSSSLGMPAFALVVVLLAFCGLALLADRVRPRGEAVREESAAMTPARRRRVA